MGRVGSCFDNAAAEAFFSSLEWEVLSRHDFENTRQAQAVVLDWCYGFYNHDRRHSSAGMMSPINYENTAAPDGKPHRETSTIRGNHTPDLPRRLYRAPNGAGLKALAAATRSHSARALTPAPTSARPQTAGEDQRPVRSTT